MTDFEMTLPMNSGAEAVETAIKAIRKWAYKVKGIQEGKAEILVADGNFHGRTTTIVSFSTDPVAYKDYGPYTPGFKIVKYGDIKDVLDNINENTAGVILEPIQGEGGIVIPPEGYLKEVKEACKKNNVLFVLDEIQSGLGRTGKLFAYEWEDARPDMVIIGKALSAGFYPVSAVLSSKEILGVFQPGEHGSTYGGNPLGAAVSIKALEVIEEEKLVQRSHELGNYFIEQLRKIESPHIVKVRGRGLWIGFVLDTKARPYTEKLVKEGILAKETHENIIRFAPPLIITKEEIDWAVEKIEKVVKELD
jgi:ornithine--oxo-acid transaminase